MTSTAFVLISTEIKKEEDILEQLRKSDIIEYAHQVYGAYDIIVKLKAKDNQEIKDYITFEMRKKIPFIRSTITMPTTGESYYNE